MRERQFPIPQPCPHCGIISECAGGICQNAKCLGKTSVERFGYELLRALEMISGSPDGTNATFDLVALPKPSGWKFGENFSIFERVVYVSARDLARDVLAELEFREQKSAAEKAKLVDEIAKLRDSLQRLRGSFEILQIVKGVELEFSETRRVGDMVKAIGPRMASGR